MTDRELALLWIFGLALSLALWVRAARIAGFAAGYQAGRLDGEAGAPDDAGAPIRVVYVVTGDAALQERPDSTSDGGDNRHP